MSRGKVSEGIDFSDAHCRVVVVVGIPFPAALDPQVELKRAYQDALVRQARGAGPGALAPISGSQWYTQQAFRALNQGVGRAIRHRHDFGSVVLLDERFGAVATQASLSRWLRPVIRTRDGIGAAMPPPAAAGPAPALAPGGAAQLPGVPLGAAIAQQGDFFAHLVWHAPGTPAFSSPLTAADGGCACPCARCLTSCFRPPELATPPLPPPPPPLRPPPPPLLPLPLLPPGAPVLKPQPRAGQLAHTPATGAAPARLLSIQSVIILSDDDDAGGAGAAAVAGSGSGSGAGAGAGAGGEGGGGGSGSGGGGGIYR